MAIPTQPGMIRPMPVANVARPTRPVPVGGIAALPRAIPGVAPARAAQQQQALNLRAAAPAVGVPRAPGVMVKKGGKVPSFPKATPAKGGGKGKPNPFAAQGKGGGKKSASSKGKANPFAKGNPFAGKSGKAKPKAKGNPFKKFS